MRGLRLFLFSLGLVMFQGLAHAATPEDHATGATPIPVEGLVSSHDSCDKGSLSPQEQVLVQKALEDLKTVQDLGPENPSFETKLAEVYARVDSGLSDNAKALLVKTFVRQNADSIKTQTSKLMQKQLTPEKYKEFRDAGMNYERAYAKVSATCEVYKGGAGIIDDFFFNVNENLGKDYKVLSDAYTAYDQLLHERMRDKDVTPEQQVRLRELIEKMRALNANASRCVQDTLDSSITRLEGEAEAVKLVRDTAIAAGVTVATLGTSAPAAGAGLAVRITVLAARGAASGASTAYAISLSVDGAKQLGTAIASGNDISCEFAKNMAKNSPEIRQAALKSALVGALFGGAFGSVLGVGGKVAAVAMTTAKVVGVGFALKGVAGATSHGIKVSEQFEEASILAGQAEEEKDLFKKNALERQAMELASKAKQEAVAAGFEGIEAVFQSWGAIRGGRSLRKSMEESRDSVRSILSKSPTAKPQNTQVAAGAPTAGAPNAGTRNLAAQPAHSPSESSPKPLSSSAPEPSGPAAPKPVAAPSPAPSKYAPSPLTPQQRYMVSETNRRVRADMVAASKSGKDYTLTVNGKQVAVSKFNCEHLDRCLIHVKGEATPREVHINEINFKEMGFNPLDQVQTVNRNSNLSPDSRVSAAESRLGTGVRLTENQRKALLEAHEFKTRPESGAFNYTKAELAQKRRILEKGGFSKEESAILMREGYAGTPTPAPTPRSAWSDNVASVERVLDPKEQKVFSEVVDDIHVKAKGGNGDVDTPMGDFSRRMEKFMRDVGPDATLASLQKAKNNLDADKVLNLKYYDPDGKLRKVLDEKIAKAMDALNSPKVAPAGHADPAPQAAPAAAAKPKPAPEPAPRAASSHAATAPAATPTNPPSDRKLLDKVADVAAVAGAQAAVDSLVGGRSVHAGAAANKESEAKRETQVPRVQSSGSELTSPETPTDPLSDATPPATTAPVAPAPPAAPANPSPSHAAPTPVAPAPSPDSQPAPVAPPSAPPASNPLFTPPSSSPASSPSSTPVKKDNWFVSIFKGIANAFKALAKFLFGWMK
jgi:hypothetical protein